eukprot:Skav212483  [mRNA]  locus=scaffold385:488075:495780:- [translate_table: standard]
MKSAFETFQQHVIDAEDATIKPVFCEDCPGQISRWSSDSPRLSVEQMRPPTAVTNAVQSWRSDGIKHKKNEIFLDVERLNLLVSANGSVLRSEILGALKMKSYLSGMPELKLGLNDKLLFEDSLRSVANNVEIHIPVPSDVDSPSFKTSIGTVRYIPDQDKKT